MWLSEGEWLLQVPKCEYLILKLLNYLGKIKVCGFVSVSLEVAFGFSKLTPFPVSSLLWIKL